MKSTFKKIFYIWTSPFTFSLLLLLCIFLLVSGTLFQIRFGLNVADNLIFNSWFQLAGGVLPLPGFRTVGILITFYIFCIVIKNLKKWLKKLSLLLIHISLLIILIYGIVNSLTQKQSYIDIPEGQTISLNDVSNSNLDFLIPVKVKLDKFTVEKWAASQNAKNYKSDITLYTNNGIQKATISMNNPLRFHDYTFYQASFTQNNVGIVSTLYVVKNKLRLFPCAATLLFLIGVLIHFISKIKLSHLSRTSLIIFLTIIPLITYKNAVAGNTDFSINNSGIKNLILVYDNQYMTFETLAKRKLCQYSGEKSPKDFTAVEWLGELLLDPQKSLSRPVFQIKNDNFLFSSNSKRLFSIRDINQYIYGRSTDPDRAYFNDSFTSKCDFSTLLENIRDYNDLSNSLSSTFTGLPTSLKYQIAVTAKQSMNYQNSDINLLPVNLSTDSLITSHFTTWIDNLKNSYYHKDQVSFNLAINSILIIEKLRLTPIQWYRAHLEAWYYQIDFKILSVFFFLLTLVFYIFRQISNFFKTGYVYIITYCTGISLLTMMLIFRTFLLVRPPVATLYETFLFVAFLSSIAGLSLWIKLRKQVLTFLGSAAGLLFFLIAKQFGNEFSTMNSVTAVLNNNFWLSVHIITIIAGYTAFLGVSLTGHFMLFQRCIDHSSFSEKWFKFLYHLLIVAIVLTCLGTALGGLWAQLSWGRFWGWDPKENGALLLLLWGVLLSHTYKKRIISDHLFTWGAMLCGIIVMYTWIGVNLLGKGIHSYGFSAAGKSVLFIFFIVEFIFVISFFSVHLFQHISKNRV